MATSKGAGAGDGDRANQPQRLNGGNSSVPAGAPSGGHGSKRGERIAIGGSKGVETPGDGFQCGGNASCGESREKHGQAKLQGKSKDIPANVRASERRHGAGNADFAGHEQHSKNKAERLNMSVDHRF